VVTEYRAGGRAKKEDLRPRLTLLDESVGRSRALPAGGGRDAFGRGRRRRLRPATCRGPRQPRSGHRRATSPAVCRAWPSWFEARKPKDNAIIAKIEGRVEFGKDYKAKRKIGDPAPKARRAVEDNDPKSKVIDVQEGDWTSSKGDNLIGGLPDPHDILEVMGVEALARYLVAEIQDVYRLAGREDQPTSTSRRSFARCCRRSRSHRQRRTPR